MVADTGAVVACPVCARCMAVVDNVPVHACIAHGWCIWHRGHRSWGHEARARAHEPRYPTEHLALEPKEAALPR